MDSRRSIRAFTLMELLAVIAIIAILAAILLPNLSTAKRAAKRTTAIDGMRQCYVALLQYVDDDGGNWTSLPSLDRARQILGRDVTWDPADTWRKTSSDPPLPHMVGSFGYVNSSPEPNSNFEIGLTDIVKREHFPLLIDIFHPQCGLSRLTGEKEDGTFANRAAWQSPAQCLVLRNDGSIKLETAHDTRLLYLGEGSSGPGEVFSWPSYFGTVSSTRWTGG